MRAEAGLQVAATADDSFEGPRGVRELRLVFSSSPFAVRRALRKTLGGLAGIELTPEECATVELVLAEVLNNVVEHAYSGARSGLIEFRIRHDSGGLLCTVIDDGTPMPDGRPPSGRAAWTQCPVHGLPEGGFGWFLIRELASDLSYVRIDGRNRLSFRLAVGQAFRTS